MRSNFKASMAEIFRHEGGYVDHPRDPGGATNMGITQATLAAARGRPVSKADVRALSRREAEDIYAKKYAAPIRYDDLPAGLDHVTLDPTINSGAARGVRWLQVAIGLVPDGKMGPKTLARAADVSPVPAIEAACRARMGFLRGLKIWSSFGRGWSRRVAETEAFAVALVQKARNEPVREAAEPQARAAEARTRRETQKAGGTGVAGGTLPAADLPEWALIVIGAVIVIGVVYFLGRRMHERHRAAAYRAAAERVTEGTQS